ncbi:MAG TPA: PAS domain-containing protein [Candidatus Acidoferrales bacterium]|nr:PAS domain-containing protein [Candidatus Acidoferrales bacterium]
MENTKPDLEPLTFLFSKISEGIAYCKIIVNTEGKPIDWIYLYVNDAYEQTNGMKKETVIGKKVTEVLPNIHQDPSDWINIYGKVALTGESVTTERYSTIRQKWYHVSAYSPQKEYFVSVFEDITERKRNDDDFRFNEERCRSVLENSLDVVYRLNLQTGRYEYMSPASKPLLGFEPEELMAMSNEELLSHVHPEDLPNLRKDLGILNEVGQGVSEYRFLGKDGKYSWWSNQMVITKDQYGKPLYRDGFVRNITEQKKADEALKKSEAKYR